MCKFYQLYFENISKIQILLIIISSANPWSKVTINSCLPWPHHSAYFQDSTQSYPVKTGYISSLRVKVKLLTKVYQALSEMVLSDLYNFIFSYSPLVYSL